MDAAGIDHPNLRIPADGTERALAFYRDGLGFEIERFDAFEAGEKPFFAVRVGPQSVFHLWPDEAFDPPTATNFDHVAVRVDESVADVKATLAAAGVTVDREGTPDGATGSAPAVYVTDPFGYGVELKAVGD
jgi:lactoylglutathione lyase